MNNYPVENPENSSAHLFSLSSGASPQPSGLGDDELLIRRTFAQDARLGFAFLFRRYHTNLCNHAIRFIHSKAVAEDIVADVFLAMWANRHFERIETSYRAYLYRAVRNRAYNCLKKELGRQVTMEDAGSGLVSASPNPDQVIQYNELQLKVEATIQQLPPQCRRAFLLHRLEGKKYEEIGRELAITNSAVERLIGRALARLRNELSQGGFISVLLLLLCY